MTRDRHRWPAHQTLGAFVALVVFVPVALVIGSAYLLGMILWKR